MGLKEIFGKEEPLKISGKPVITDEIGQEMYDSISAMSKRLDEAGYSIIAQELEAILAKAEGAE